MDFATLKTTAALYIRRAGDTAISGTLLPDFLNAAQDELSRRFKPRFLRKRIQETPVDGTSIYTITTERILRITQIRFEDSNGVEKKPWLRKGFIMNLISLYPATLTADQPVYWDYAMNVSGAQKVEQLEVFPKPNAVTATGKFNIYGYFYLPALSENTDKNPFTEEIPYALIYAACAQVKFYLEQGDKALEFMAMAERLLCPFIDLEFIKNMDDPFVFQSALVDNDDQPLGYRGGDFYSEAFP